MKKRFREKSFRGRICIKYKDADGNDAIWDTDQKMLIDLICAVIEVYAAEGDRLTARQLYYQLVAKDIIPNAIKVYKRVCALLVDLRYAGIVDWDAIEDRGRTPSRPSQWDSVSDLIESALCAYRLPRWKNQEYYVELYCEKQALEGVLGPVAEKYHIYFGANKGYSSASTMYEMARRMDNQLYADKKCVILYLGDHDPSGLNMVEDIQKRTCEFLGLSIEDNGDCFETVQLALNIEQVKLYKPPFNPARMEDPRAKEYIRKYGKKSWELDALEPKILREIAEQGILEYIDMAKYRKWKKQEKQEAKKLKEFGETLKNR